MYQRPKYFQWTATALIFCFVLWLAIEHIDAKYLEVIETIELQTLKQSEQKQEHVRVIVVCEGSVSEWVDGEVGEGEYSEEYINGEVKTTTKEEK